MPQLHPAVPSYPALARAARRVLLTLTAGLALTAAPAVANGGAEAGDPAVASSRAAAPAAAPSSRSAAARPSRALVRSVQRKLGLRADGAYGPRTRAAVRRYQRRHGLRADGRLGPATLRALGVRVRAARAAAAPAAAGDTARLLAAIAQCESGGDPRAVSANGKFRGKYQFLTSTWKSMGGTGDPAAANEAEQDQRAAALLAAQGTKPWPVCGKQAQST